MVVFFIFYFLIVIFELSRKQRSIVTNRNILIVSTAISSGILLYPAYRTMFSVFHSLLLAVQHTIRLFAFHDRYLEMIEKVEGLTEYYMVTLAAFYIIAPMLTVSVVISLFKNIASYLKYKLSFHKKVHIFSELNERTLTLGKSLDDKYNRIGGNPANRYKLFKEAAIVYADIMVNNEEEYLDLLDGAKKIGAILFKKDLTTIHFGDWLIFKRNKKELNFYLISKDEREKISHTEHIIRTYKSNPNVKLFLFSDSIEAKCFLNVNSEATDIQMKVVRIDDIRSLIYHNLDDHGLELFENANRLPDGTREISAVVVGLGKYGLEVMKALLWYCQLPGYRVKVIAFDERKESKSMFRAACPELKLGTAVDQAGDMRYTADIYEAKFGTEEFYEQIEKINDMTYLFVALGTDKQNIEASVGIKNRLANKNCFPAIEAVVYDTHLKEYLNKDWRTDKIRVIGDLKTFYSEHTVVDPALENCALQVHQRWGIRKNSENNFYMNDYNYCSSMASALHRNLRTAIKDYAQISERDPKTVFPFYYGDGEQRALKEANLEKASLERILPMINDNGNLIAISARLAEFETYLYIKLAHIHYGKLSVSERAFVLLESKAFMETKKLSVVLPMATDTKAYLAGYDTCIENLKSDGQKKVLRNLFDCIVKIKTDDITDIDEKFSADVRFEYDALTEEEKAEVRSYVCRHVKDMNEEQFYANFADVNCFACLEHIRWNAYMRTQGFRPAKKTNKRYNQHHNIVPVELLTFVDRINDI